MSVTIIDTINNFNVDDDTTVTLRYEDRHEGWHSTGELEDEAVRETSTAEAVAALITNKTLQVRTSFGDETAIDNLRDTGLLDSYERGEFAFEEFITETIQENPWDCDSLIEFEIVQYDHKRGRCDVTSQLKTTVGNIRKASSTMYGLNVLGGWTASFSHSGGTFSTEL